MTIPLAEYKRKRDFAITREPPPVRKAGGPELHFVIQKHAASRLHYDFRLEVGGVLVSWAVPKGPSLDPQERHLAVKVEDHPFDYKDFEGVIPEGQYGAGEVIVWDEGVYLPITEDHKAPKTKRSAAATMKKALADGKVSVILLGKKLAGAFTLVKLKDKESDWLLLKQDDEYAKPGKDITKQDKSVVSGKSLKDIRKESEPKTKAKSRKSKARSAGAKARSARAS